MKILSGKQVRARKVLLYGVHGIGKSTWAANAPSPIFLNVEDGVADIDCAKTEKLGSLAEVIDAVSWLSQNPHEFQTIVVDTLDWLEHLIFRDVAKAANKANIADIGYGKGYDAAREKWDFLLRGFDHLRKSRDMLIVMLAHAKIQRYDNPETESYDRYELDLHKSSNGMLQEWADEVLFASYRVFTRKDDQGFGKERKIAIGNQERYIRTVETPAAIAKNRLNLPGELKMDWQDFARFLPARQTNISGVVVNGSSKPVAEAAGV